MVVDVPGVSVNHAQLRWTGSGWEVRDLMSSNGTWLDGRLLPLGSHPVVSGQVRFFARDPKMAHVAVYRAAEVQQNLGNW